MQKMVRCEESLVFVNHVNSVRCVHSCILLTTTTFSCGTFPNVSPDISPIGSSVLKYDVTTTSKDGSGVVPMADELQTLEDTTFEQNGETSVLTFTQKLVDVGQPAITDESSWIFAVGLPDNQWEGSHKVHSSFFLPLEEGCVASGTVPAPAPAASSSSGAQAGFVMREDVSETTRPLWVAHGWTMAIAWGVVGPLAIGSAVLRSLVGSYWYKIHFYLNMLCVLSTVVGFALAVAAIQMEEKSHFTRDGPRGDEEQVHHIAGLAIFIIVVLQSIAAYFRPPATSSAAAPATKGNGDTNTELDSQHAESVAGKTDDSPPQGDTLHDGLPPQGDIIHDDDQNSVLEIETPLPLAATTVYDVTPTDGEEDSSQDTPATAAGDEKQSSPPTLWRKVWEMQHRLTGTVLIGLAWYNCHSGYQLMAESYDESYDCTIIFWSVTGAIAGSIFMLKIATRFLQYRKQRESNENTSRTRLMNDKNAKHRSALPAATSPIHLLLFGMLSRK
jgi:hypothetical protein